LKLKMLIIGSATRTMRAQELLGRHGIFARIKRLDNPSEGCVRALLVEDGQSARAKSLLADGGIAVKRIEDVRA